LNASIEIRFDSCFLFVIHFCENNRFNCLSWIQRQRIDTRNSSKLSSETCWINANVLEETTSTTSCILSLCLFKKKFFCWFSPSLVLKEFWNNLSNVRKMNFSFLKTMSKLM
jgi:hypothetical protein